MNERLERLKKDKNYHGHTTTLSEKDDRVEKYLDQIDAQGFDMTELWNLDVTFVSFMLPRLICYKEKIAENELENETVKDLEYIIKYFSIRAEDKEYNFDREIQYHVQESYNLFAKVISRLWY